VGPHRPLNESTAEPFEALLHRIAACRVCEAELPLGPRPVVQADPRAVVLIVGQAPGRRVHATGLPFNDPSGDRLRRWLGVDRATFYDPSRFAIVPMGFCYPGTGKSGDAPPMPQCAPLWRPVLLPRLTAVRLTVAVGRYAIEAHLRRKGTVADIVRRWREFDDIVPTPHPSPRNLAWFTRNPWFEADLLPDLRHKVAQALA
jgi:uracil-DNA glycosylase